MHFNNKKLFILAIAIFVLVILLFTYFKIMNKYRNDRIFALESEKYAKEVSNPVFRIQKVMMYSDANVEDYSESQNLSRINVSQFTDFAIYIDNTVKQSQLTAENTINHIDIDNIGITAMAESGTQKFSSKKIEDLGKYVPIQDSSKEIVYQVAHTNVEKETVDKSKSFYTDCQEPLILSYVNENIVEAADASASGEKLSLDGSILKYLNINLENLNYKITFTINIENNLGEKFFCNCSFNVALDAGEGDGIYSGYIMQIIDLSKGDFRFKKVS